VNSIQNPAYATGMEARFAAAARHSRMVRVLRVAVPAAVLLAMLMLTVEAVGTLSCHVAEALVMVAVLPSTTAFLPTKPVRSRRSRRPR